MPLCSKQMLRSSRRFIQGGCEEAAEGAMRIGRFFFSGHITAQTCGSCWTHLVYYDKHDATFCPACNTWAEAACRDLTCFYCASRPKRSLGRVRNQARLASTAAGIAPHASDSSVCRCPCHIVRAVHPVPCCDATCGGCGERLRRGMAEVHPKRCPAIRRRHGP